MTKDEIEYRLLKAGELARALNVKSAFITRMKHAGFAMPGRRATVRWALTWLESNPSFDGPPPRREDGENCQTR